MFATVKENGNLLLHSRTDFININENVLYCDSIKNINISFITQWLKDPKIRTYDKIDFLPKQYVPDKIYNSFKGFQGEKTTLIKTDIENSLIMRHMKEVICNNNNDVFDYFVKFMANLLQHPNNKANTALIFKSIQGAGKDTIFKWFGNNILGKEYYLNEDNIDLIFGRFNSCIENKILIVLNEVSGKDTFSINEKIKNAITRELNIIEHKGLKPYENTNNIGFVYLTNNDNPLKIPHDDRRFCGFECNNNKANDYDYFRLLNKEINKCEYDRAFYEYFIKIDTIIYLNENMINIL